MHFSGDLVLHFQGPGIERLYLQAVMAYWEQSHQAYH